jgi:hypothetical protein
VTIVWTPWTVGLAWGDLLVDMHLSEHPKRWSDQPDVWSLYAIVLIGRATHATAVRADLPMRRPGNLRRLPLAAVTEVFDQADSVERLMVPELDPEPAELGAVEDRAVEQLRGTDAGDRLRQLCARIGADHVRRAAKLHENGTLGGRRHAYDGQRILSTGGHAEYKF